MSSVGLPASVLSRLIHGHTRRDTPQAYNTNRTHIKENKALFLTPEAMMSPDRFASQVRRWPQRCYNSLGHLDFPSFDN